MTDDTLLDNLRWVTGELYDAQQRLHTVTAEPVAIIGMACRFPGGVSSAEQLWRLVADGRDAMGEFPTDRGWAAQATPHFSRIGGFIDQATEFDAEFFGISPREAVAMDPQQRVLLETAWHALENAGIAPDSLRGSATGVFAGVYVQGYGFGAEVPDNAEGYAMTGGASSVVSGRVAYLLGLEGPAVSVDTACSSSLVALHQAVHSVRTGESDLALVGGVTVMPNTEVFAEFARQGGLAADGRCKAFSDDADGTGFGEGAGVLVVERLSRAVELGHEVLAVVRGTAVNQDGASNGLTAPNGPAQQRVIERALANAGLAPADVDAVEAHGTGTTLGDPIEAQALLATYGADRRAGRPLWLGSVKSNIGHTQAAAGVAGVIKMVAAMRRGVLPKTLHAATPSTRVDWSAGAVRLLTEPRDWPVEDERPRRAGVSSFGISGTNAHVIIEQAPAQHISESGNPGRQRGPVPWILSARTPGALREQARQLLDHLDGRPAVDPLDVGWSLLHGRARLPHRAVAVGWDIDELRSGLADFARTTPQPASRATGGLVFVFPGQGAQWLGMGRELHRHYPEFAAAFDEAIALLNEQLGCDLPDILWGNHPDRVHDTVFAQAGLFAAGVGVSRLLAAFGIRPDIVMGHSIGEVTAAYAAGVLTLRDAAALVAARGRLMQALPGGGAMVAVAATSAEVTPLLVPGVGVAAVNAPGALVLSGDADAVAEIADRLRNSGHRVTALRVSHAFHSARMEPMLDDFRTALARLTFSAPVVPVISNLDGALVDPDRMATPEYWVRHVRDTVRFADGVTAATAAGARAFVVLGPDGGMGSLLEQCLAAAKVSGTVTVSGLRHDRSEARSLVSGLGELFTAGWSVTWTVPFADRPARRVTLPGYPFQRRRFWLTSSVGAADMAALGFSSAAHPLARAVVPIPETGGVLVTGALSLTTHPWLADHAVGEVVLLPGTALLELAMWAGAAVGTPDVHELTVLRPLVLPATATVTTQVVVGGADDTGRRPITVYAKAADTDWVVHAQGVLTPSDDADSRESGAQPWPPAGATAIDIEDVYERLAERGYDYGPLFRGLRSVWQRDDELFVTTALPEFADDAERFGVHPALLDAVLHAAAAQDTTADPTLPFAWQGVSLHATGAAALRARITPGDNGTVSLRVADETGRPVLTVRALSTRPATIDALPDHRDVLLTVRWAPAPTADSGPVSFARWGAPDASTAAIVVFDTRDHDQSGTPQVRTRSLTSAVLAVLQEFTRRDDFAACTLLVVTEGAVAAAPGDTIDPARAAVWGMVRSAQAEEPGRILLADIDIPVGAEVVGRIVATGETEFALRAGVPQRARLTRSADGAQLVAPEGPWRLRVTQPGAVEPLALVGTPAAADLGSGEVRLAVYAAGLNFRDVLISLGMYPGEGAVIGSEAAGVVLAVGPDVTEIAVGDRVMGLIPDGPGPVVVTDQRMLIAMPADWTFAEAAAVNLVHLTAFYALHDLAGLQRGERVLVHAATGGVGMAAVRLARHWGAEVFATASAGKWDALRAAGFDDAHIGDSRSLTFEPKFRAATAGAGMDVVLDSLAGEFVDASLRLLPRGGRFVEMGKTDLRDAAAVAARHPGVRYRAFDLMDAAGLDRVGAMLRELSTLFEEGFLGRMPVRAWDIHRAPEAFRYFARAGHIGKIVLTIPQPGDDRLTAGTVVITGGTGGLGALLARHLVAAHGVRSLVLASRRGDAAPGARELIAELTDAGASVRVLACDIATETGVSELLRAVPARYPLAGVVHTAGVLDDGVLAAMTPERLETVLAAKADGAWLLHEATRDRDLALFVLFSSAVSVLGAAGQANYAAANSFLDGLAELRRAGGLAATSIGWGLWSAGTGMTGDLDTERLRRSGFRALDTEQALTLFDSALTHSAAAVTAIGLETAALRARPETVPPILRELVAVPGRERRAESTGLRRRLAEMPRAQRLTALLDTVRTQAAAVLGHTGPEAIDPDRTFGDLGFDSLTAVEARNRLRADTGLTLSPTLIFDYPTARAVADYLHEALDAHGPRERPPIPTAPTASTEPLAIVGMGCRFPGGVDSAEALWDLVLDGRDAVDVFPTDRGWDFDSLFAPGAPAGGTSIARAGGFLADADLFDAGFFGISPREATAMDPQQRVLLETVWGALEHAGIEPGSLRGTDTGVFVGVFDAHYGSGLTEDSADGVEGYRLTGGASSVVSGRISYVLGLQGPAVSVDTACSSSLVALHQAAQSLRSGESELALVGGVTIMATPAIFVEFSRQQGMAPDGRCKPFADAADGVGWGEGAGVLVLERLSRAQESGHRVLAVLRGAAVNQDGASSGLTAPNGPSQQRVIRRALADAGLTPADVDAVEAHGTGTKLGDPIEAQALVAVYGGDRQADQPLWLGSLKSNIGHTQAAAGVAGVIKMVQALRYGVLPRTLHVDAPTSRVDWTGGGVELLAEQREWTNHPGRPRRAGVSSFGISGTNAHVVLEQAPEAAPSQEAETAPEAVVPWVVSARTPEALAAQASRLREFLATHPGARPVDVGWSLVSGRTRFEHRAVLVGADRDRLETALATVTDAAADPVGAGTTVLVFPGQGAQRRGLGQELYGRFPAFADAFDAVTAELDALLGVSLREILWGTGSNGRLDDTVFAQAGLFAVSTALFRLLERFGVRTDFVMGHSVGEIVAAHVSGVLTLRDAAALVTARGRLMQALPAGGAMTAVSATEAQVREYLVDGVDIAAVNAPAAVVISGERSAVAEVADRLARAGHRAEPLRVSHAFHSALMEPMLADFAAALADLSFDVPTIPLLSNVDGALVDSSRMATPEYWVQHARAAVRFADGVRAAAASGGTHFVVAGPDGGLTNLIEQNLTARTGVRAVSTLRRDRSEAETLLSMLAELDAAGVPVRWDRAFDGLGRQRIDMPGYTFQRSRYWLEPGLDAGAAAVLGVDATGHPLLGAALTLPDAGGAILGGRLSTRSQPWLADHAIGAVIVFPGTGFVELAAVAGAEIGCPAIRELTVTVPLVLPDDRDVRVRVYVGVAEADATRSVTVSSRTGTIGESAWVTHAEGIVGPNAGALVVDPELRDWPPRDAEAIDLTGCYQRLAERGYDYGPAFRGLRAAFRRGEELFVSAELPETATGAHRFELHPALLDAVLHALGTAADPASDAPVLPFAWRDVELAAAGATSVRARVVPTAADTVALTITDSDGAPVMSVSALTSRATPLAVAGAADPLLALNWSATDILEEKMPWEPWESAGTTPAPTVVFDTRALGDRTAGPVANAHRVARAVLLVLQEFMTAPRFASSRLVVVTRDAVAVSRGDVVDPAAAAIWGLVRSAQSEDPDRIVLADIDDGAFDGALGSRAQLAVRAGRRYVPGLARVPMRPQRDAAAGRLAAGTVVITGGTGSLGAIVARHLVADYGVRSLVLGSRRGMAAAGAEELVEDLTAAGAAIRLVACDVASAAGVAALLEAVPAEFPLAGLVHAAGVLDDGVVASLTPERLDAVLAAKADAAWHLHEATRECDLAVFVLFSSLSGVLGAPGQGNYAAANAFLDGLAEYRATQQLPATSIAWGLWRSGGMASRLSDAEHARLRRGGLGALSVQQALELFDTAIGQGRSSVAATRWDATAMAALGRERLPMLLWDLVADRRNRTGRPRHAGGGAASAGPSLRQEIVAQPDEKRFTTVLAAVRVELAGVLGHSDPEQLRPDRNFRDLGFDSLTAVEARNRLRARTGLVLSPTLVFDYPTPDALARHLLREILGQSETFAAATTGTSNEPVAIVGMGCRYPGGVTSPEELWRLVVECRDGIGVFPTDRGWDLAALFDPDPDAQRVSLTREGGFLYDAAEFDPEFFGISPREAVATDPQQRLLLETVWEALEHAGIPPETLRGSDTGVFMGVMYHDYPASAATGSIVSGRIAYTLGLEGPAVSVDTACSSSLVALHQAVHALRAGESELALVGGVTVLSTPEVFVEFTKQRGLAADGRCKSFADSADGVGWAEGVGVLVVERLSRARELGHNVLAVVRGSAVNQDGASNGLTAPNGPAQQRVIRRALASAGLTTADIDVVEAHGTGTTLGDPIEAQALLATYGQDRPADRPLWLGSLKSNVGHTQAAAGVGGIIKMVQAMRYAVMPATLHADTPSTKVDWSVGRVELLTRHREWTTEAARPRRAGVSSFGISGTNAHVILEQALPEPVPATGPATRDRRPVPWVLSARGPHAVVDQARRLLEHCVAVPNPDPVDIGWSLLTGRSEFEHRAVIVGDDCAAMMAQLAAMTAGPPARRARVTGPVVLVFPGQGGQWPEMGRALLGASEVFAEAITQCDSVFRPLLGWSPRDVLAGAADAPALERDDVVQPVSFVVMVGLARLWSWLGVIPDAVIGHSQGEVAAAYVAGALSLADAATIVVARSKLVHERLAGSGAMASVSLGVDRVRELLGQWGTRLSIAADNGPAAVTIAGEPEAVAEFTTHCEREGVHTRILPVAYASHSPQVDTVAEELLAELAGITPRQSAIPFYSTVTGVALDTAGLDARYWLRNLRETVRFVDTVRGMLEEGHTTFVEVGAHPVLTGALTDLCDENGVGDHSIAVGTLRRDDGGLDRFLRSAAELAMAGVPVAWTPAFDGLEPRSVPLPTYAFQRTRYWLDGGPVSGATSLGLDGADHPILRAIVPSPETGGVVLTGRLSLSTHPWLADHMVNGVALFPGTGFIDLALRAGDEIGCPTVRELTLTTPLPLSADNTVDLQVVVGAADASGARPVSVYSRSSAADGWVTHAEGQLGERIAAAARESTAWPPRDATEIDIADLYDELASDGYGYGPAFQGLRSLARHGGELFAHAKLPEAADPGTGRFALHPALLDTVLHALASAGDPTDSAPSLPFAWTRVTLHALGVTEVRARITRDGDGDVRIDVSDADGAPVLTVESLRLRPMSTAQLAVPHRADPLLALRWVAVDPSAGVETVLAYTYWNSVNGEVPPVVVLEVGRDTAGRDVVARVRETTHRILAVLQEFLGDGRFGASRLLVLTHGAIAVSGADTVDPVAAAVWGLTRSAATEEPDRIMLADIDSDTLAPGTVELLLAVGEPQVALRSNTPHVARLRHLENPSTAARSGPWRLDVVHRGVPDGVGPVRYPPAEAVLDRGQVRLAVRAAGLNFRDVMICLGLYPDQEAVVGSDIAGVVVEVGPDVTGISVGDRVMGLSLAGVGPIVVTDARLLVPMPAGWTYAEAAAVPTVFATAWYGLRDLGEIHSGERLLVHAATGGVGMAAVQLARHWGVEVFATASHGKQDTLRRLGFDDDHRADSRTLTFEERISAATGGSGVDVVLDSLAGEFVDASLRLLPRGGRFLEMGKTDIRDSAEVAQRHPGVRYRAFDLMEAGHDRIQEILHAVSTLIESGVLQRIPVRAWDIQQAGEAFRYFSRAVHVGKIVLTVPEPALAQRLSRGTVVITGGTGGLGVQVARHLAAVHGARSLVLASRRGISAPGAAELAEELTAAGAHVRIAACDVTTRTGVAALFAEIPTEYPIVGVVHAAGVLDDGVLAALTPERLDTVRAPKADAAWYLHEATRNHDLAIFVLFSSLAGVLGAPGQANYAAANTFVDALAETRRAEGLPALSIAWGLWSAGTGMTGHLDAAATDRLGRTGFADLSLAQGLAQFDAALARGVEQVVATRIDARALRRHAEQGVLPPVLRELVAAPRRAVTAEPRLRARLAESAPAEHLPVVLELVRGHAAAVLGHHGAAAIPPDRNFRDLGFDSLTSVEMRNRLKAATGLALPPTLVFDHPSPEAVARHVLAEIMGQRAPNTTAPRHRVHPDTEPIAIVGMGCRFPGGVASPEDLWQLVFEGRDALGPLPRDRGWDTDRIYHPDPGTVGSSYVRAGGFLDDAGRFDADFFGISPREALAMDPQQRQLLETVWEALEHAGIDPTSLRGTETGVFIGIFDSYYALGSSAASGSRAVEGYRVTGGASSVASGRIAYALGIEGPAVSLDTACSSSLVALHQAVAALRSGECDTALVGGVTVMSTPGLFIEFSRQRGMAPDGRCKSFAAAADGVGWGEGVGVLVVQRLSDALASGREVLAVVRGTAVNQDGASNGLTAPNGPAQQRVIERALASAGLRASEIDAVEAHGTGTRLGDPIEAQALLATYGQNRRADRPLWLGSVKSNIGHTQAAAGVAGIIKMVAALRHGVLPQTLHVDAPSDQVDWSQGAVELLTERRKWDSEGPRRAAVSAFGISGTNAHVILEQASAVADSTVSATPGRALPWVISAGSRDALLRQCSRLAEHVVRNPGVDAADIGWSLVSGRASLPHRAVVVGADREESVAGLRSLTEATEPAAGVRSGVASPPGRVVFVFPGQGGQWPGMGHELLDTSQIFAAAVADCDVAFQPLLGWSVAEVLRSADDPAERVPVDVAQPVAFTMLVGLAALWQSLGVVPDAVLGHSQGEVAAAYVAGALSLADAARVVAARSRLIRERLAGRGAMVSAFASEAAVADHMMPWAERISIASVNGPSSVVVSGETEALDEFERSLSEAGIWRWRVPGVNFAAHSPQIEQLSPALHEELASIAPVSGRIPFYSTVTGDQIDTAGLDAGYWYRNLRHTVRFEAATSALLSAGHSVFIEVGPHPVVTAGVQGTMDAAGLEETTVVVDTLRRDEGGLQRVLTAAAELYVAGVPVNWRSIYENRAACRVPLPAYPFGGTRYWLTGAGADPSSLGVAGADHPLLGAIVTLPETDGVVATARLSPSLQPWLADHRLGGVILLPGAALVELAARVGSEVGCAVIRELTLLEPLRLPEGGVDVRVSVGGTDDAGNRPVSMYTQAGTDAPWVLHAQGQLAIDGTVRDDLPEPWPPRDAVPVAVHDAYERLAELSFDYGPAFRGVRSVWRRGGETPNAETSNADAELFVEAVLPESASTTEGFGLHPALLDAVLHALALGGDPSAEQTMLPFEWRDVSIHRAGATAVRARITPVGANTVSIAVSDDAGPIATVGALSLRAISPRRLTAARDRLLVIDWRPAPLAPAVEPVAYAAWPPVGPTPASVLVLDTRLPRDPGDITLPRAHEVLHRVLAAIREFLAAPAYSACTLLVLTERAVAVTDGDIVDPAGAAVWGLVRVAQSEHPGRILLADTDTDTDTDGDQWATYPRGSQEQQFAVRSGVIHLPRLVRRGRAAIAPPPEVERGSLTGGTVVITGGTGGLGSHIARHLVAEYGVESLVLASRRGLSAPGATALRDELAASGVTVEVIACDVSSRSGVAELLSAIPPAAPLRGIVHTAGVLDDGVITALSPARMDAVLGPKADAAWHLHDATRDLDLALFVMFSSIAGVLGAAGQGNYAAANGFLDGLARHRRSAGLPAVSIAWGLWASSGGMIERLDEASASRLRRGVLREMPIEQGLALFDAALAGEHAGVVAAELDSTVLMREMTAGTLPPMLRGLVTARRETTGVPARADLRDQLSRVPAPERLDVVLDAVRGNVAFVLGHPDPAAIGADRNFKDLGFDSLTAVELRNRLKSGTGLALPASLVFDFPTPEHVARELLRALDPTVPEDGTSPGHTSDRTRPEPVVFEDLDPADLVRYVLDNQLD